LYASRARQGNDASFAGFFYDVKHRFVPEQLHSEIPPWHFKRCIYQVNHVVQGQQKGDTKLQKT
jgi:hypothetical protein